MRKKLILILVVFSLFISCVKQSTRYSEPELKPEKYNLENAKMRSYYYKKHLSSVLQRSEKLSIEPEQRGKNKEKEYARIIVADIITKNAKGKTNEQRNRVIAIENYGLRDKSGFNPYDFIMVSKYVYDYSTDKVIHYKVKNGDPENVARVDSRELNKKELNAFLLSDEQLFKIIEPLFYASANKLNSLKTKIRKEHTGKTISEFLIKKAKLVRKVTAKKLDRAGEEFQANITLQVFLENGKTFLVYVLYPPNQIVQRLVVGKFYNNIVVNFDDLIFGKGKENMPGGSASVDVGKYSVVIVDYIRGLENVEAPMQDNENQNKENGNKDKQPS